MHVPSIGIASLTRAILSITNGTNGSSSNFTNVAWLTEKIPQLTGAQDAKLF